MAVTSQTIVDGSRISVISTVIVGNGGDLTDQVIYDASSFVDPTTDNKIMWIKHSMVGFSGFLSWDATANIVFYPIPAEEAQHTSFVEFGGIINNAGAGKTGDILLTTSGLGSGDTGLIIFQINKK